MGQWSFRKTVSGPTEMSLMRLSILPNLFPKRSPLSRERALGSQSDWNADWPLLEAAAKRGARGAALLRELSALIVRQDAFSPEWSEDRRLIRAKIEAHLNEGRDGEPIDRPRLPQVVDTGAHGQTDDLASIEATHPDGAARKASSAA